MFVRYENGFRLREDLYLCLERSLARQQSYRSRFRAPATLVTVLSFSISLNPNCGATDVYLTLCRNTLYDVVHFMTSNTLESDRIMSKSESMLEPLPSLNVITNVEKLDAGLRSLDHCELLPQSFS